MNCPKCEEGSLSKIRFIADKKLAYLCDTCGCFWLETEHIDKTTGHTMEGKQQSEQGSFVFLKEEDLQRQEDADKTARKGVGNIWQET